jgi:hypothetical protein
MSEDRAYHRVPGVLETALEGELILLDPATQEMFSLNRTGMFVWRALPAHDPAAIAAKLAERFAVPPQEALADVRALLDALLAAGLVRFADGAPG